MFKVSLPEEREGMKMAESLAVPKDSIKVGTARRTADLISQAQPVLLVCLGYYAGAWIAKTLRFPDSNLSLIWPPTAILLGALLLAPPRKWWIYLLARRSSPCLGPVARRSVGWRDNQPAHRQF